MFFESISDDNGFSRVFKGGQRRNGKFISLIVARGLDVSKFGIIVNKRFGSAARRNRIKRLIRESIRKLAGKINDPIEVVVIPRASADRAVQAEIATDISSLVFKRSFHRT